MAAQVVIRVVLAPAPVRTPVPAALVAVPITVAQIRARQGRVAPAAQVVPAMAAQVAPTVGPAVPVVAPVARVPQAARAVAAARMAVAVLAAVADLL